MMFGKHKKQNSSKAVLDISIGSELMFHGRICEITNVKSTQETTFVRLSFSVVDGRKTGTDGWYDLVRLQKDPQIYNNKNSDSNTITENEKEVTLQKLNMF